jgi:hypothetical protein
MITEEPSIYGYFIHNVTIFKTVSVSHFKILLE